MSDRKRNEGWRADKPNRHKREINYILDLNQNVTSLIDQKRRITKDKPKRRSS